MSLPRYPDYRHSGLDWLGVIPAHWSAMPINALATLNDETLPESTESELEIDYVDVGSVSLSGGIERTESMTFADAPSRARRMVRDGDVLVSTVRTYLKAIAPVVSPAPNLIASTGFAVVRPKPGQYSGYLKYGLQCEAFVHQVIARSNGVSYPAINASDLARIQLWNPPFAEQRAIASFLDRETAKIDALIAEQEKLLALLAEKRQATISHTVTRGLDSNVPMKDSGIPWLGDVPAHWAVKQLKHVARPGTAITYGIVQAGPHFEGGIPYIKTSDMAGESLPLDGYALTSPEIDAAYARSKVSPGDLVIAIRATIGKCLAVPPELDGANLTQGTAKVSPSEEIASDFLLELLRSSSSQVYFDSMAKGATFKEITLDALRRTSILVPPMAEQLEIVRFVGAEGAKFGALGSDAEQAIGLLKERRSALIAAAVTGKIDVRGLTEQVAA